MLDAALNDTCTAGKCVASRHVHSLQINALAASFALVERPSVVLRTPLILLSTASSDQLRQVHNTSETKYHFVNKRMFEQDILTTDYIVPHDCYIYIES